MIQNPASVIPHRSYIAVLEYRCDKLERKLKSTLGRIFAAQRLQSRFSEIISDVKPVWTNRALGRWATEQNGTVPSDGEGTLHPEFVSNQRFYEVKLRVVTEPLAASSGHCIHRLKADCCATCVALQDPKRCVLGRRLGRLVRAKEDAPKGGFIDNRYVGCAAPSGEKCLRRVEPKFADALSLAEYAARHQDGWVAWSGWVNWCPKCNEYVGQVHSCNKWQAKKELAAKEEAVKLRAEQEIDALALANRKKWAEQRRRAALIAQGLWYQPEEFDRHIVKSRKEAVEADLITKFDRDLSRKGNKYRIQQHGTKWRSDNPPHL